jgi:hypothetical protein
MALSRRPNDRAAGWRAAVTDQDHGLPRSAAGDHLGLAHAIRRSGADGPGQVRDLPFIAGPGQFSRNQIPGDTADQRAVDKQKTTSHAPVVSARRKRAYHRPGTT